MTSETALLNLVGSDDLAMGAAYFLAKGYRNLGYAAFRGTALDSRAQGFLRAAERAKARCFVLEETAERSALSSPSSPDERMRRWLNELPRPIGILCNNDRLAWVLTEQCAALDIPVPEGISVLGVDNDATVCALSNPPLSSV